MIVREVAARAWLAQPEHELDQARRRARDGDPDWQLWVEEFDRGEAALADMRVSLTVELDGGSSQTVATENHSIWLQIALHPPALAAVIAEISSKDFEALTARLEKLGHTVPVAELEGMYVSVEIAEDLLGTLRPPSIGARTQARARARLGITTENA